MSDFCTAPLVWARHPAQLLQTIQSNENDELSAAPSFPITVCAVLTDNNHQESSAPLLSLLRRLRRVG